MQADLCADADATQATQSQAQTQTNKPAAAPTKYILVNKLHGAVTLQQKEAELVYMGFVETILNLILRNEGAPCSNFTLILRYVSLIKVSSGNRMTEGDLEQNWLPKLGLKKTSKLPHQTQKVEELIYKRMVSEAFLKRRKIKDSVVRHMPSDTSELVLETIAFAHSGI